MIKNNLLKINSILLLILFNLILFAYISEFDNSQQNQFNYNNINQIFTSSSAFIEIKNNSDFNLYANGGGNGTAQNPWIIENLSIVYDNLSYSGILISNTNDYFIIRNCSIIGCGGGIILTNAPNGIIINNTLSEIYLTPIYVYGNSDNTTIEENEIFNSIKSPAVSCILVDYSKNVSIIKNRIYNNTNYGESAIKYRDASDGLILSNIIYNNIFSGIKFGACNNMIVSNNTIYNNKVGIQPESSRNIRILYNQIYNNIKGIELNGINNSVCYNTIYNNSEVGINGIELTNFNISFNNFIENGVSDFLEYNKHIVLSLSNGIVNLNYYHSHRSPDNDKDGIIDNPYLVYDFANEKYFDLNPSANYYNYSQINYFTRPFIQMIDNESEYKGFTRGKIFLKWDNSILYSSQVDVSYSVWISNDNGSNWIRISNYIKNTTFLFDSNQYQDGFNYSIKILANNSFNQFSQFIISNINLLNNITAPKIIKPINGDTLKGLQLFEWSPAKVSLTINITYYLYYIIYDRKILLGITNSTQYLVNTTQIEDKIRYNIKFIVCAFFFDDIEICSEDIIVNISNYELLIFDKYLPHIILFIKITQIYIWKNNFKKIRREFDF